jgi:hypothetical protein
MGYRELANRYRELDRELKETHRQYALELAREASQRVASGDTNVGEGFELFDYGPRVYVTQPFYDGRVLLLQDGRLVNRGRIVQDVTWSDYKASERREEFEKVLSMDDIYSRIADALPGVFHHNGHEVFGFRIERHIIEQLERLLEYDDGLELRK